MSSVARLDEGCGHRFALLPHSFLLVALGLGLPSHRALHAVGQPDVFELNQCHFDAPCPRVVMSRIFRISALIVGFYSAWSRGAGL